MHRATREFLTGLIDYAGLFPPAGLDLEDAIQRHADDRRGDDAWMLSRFICPGGRLADLASFGPELLSDPEPLAVSALSRAAPTGPALLANVSQLLDQVAAFEQRAEGSALADVLEVRLPDSPVEAERFIGELAALVSERVVRRTSVYFELPDCLEWEVRARAAIEGIASARSQHGDALPLGFKLRCGGVVPEAYPSVERVRLSLVACHRSGVPLKATAGLHHPVRHYRDDLGVSEHGFLNLFGAGALLHAGAIGPERVSEVLESEEASRFALGDGGFRFDGATIDADAIARARREAVVSFGSCSFDEPRDDLRSLAIL